MNDARFYLFEPVRFPADVNDSFDQHVSSPQQPKGLLPTGLSLRVRALCAEMEFIVRRPSEEVRGKTVRRYDLSGLVTELKKYAEANLAERGLPVSGELPHDE